MAKPKEQEQETMVLISATALRSLLKSDDAHKEKIDGLVGELREEIGNAVEKKHLNKAAYAMLKKLHRIKSNEELHSLWHTLVRYVELSGVMARIDSVSELPIENENASLPDNIRRLQTAAE